MKKIKNFFYKNAPKKPDKSQKSVLIATPMYGGNGTGAYTRSILQLFIYHSKVKTDTSLRWQTVVNESLIPRGRNTLVHMFMKSECTHILFIDADMKWDPADVARMIDADVDVIAGVCPKKEINWNAITTWVKSLTREQIQSITTKEIMHHGKSFVCTPLVPGIYDRENIFEIKHGGSAFMLIKREVFDKLRDKVEWYHNDVNDLGGIMQIGDIMYEYFSSRVDVEERKLLSEDYFFCKLCRENGIKVYAAPWADIGHWGGYLF